MYFLTFLSQSPSHLAVAKQFSNVLARLARLAGLAVRGQLGLASLGQRTPRVQSELVSVSALSLRSCWTTRIFDLFHMALTGSHWLTSAHISSPTPTLHPTPTTPVWLFIWLLVIHLMFLTCHDVVMWQRQTQGGRLYLAGGREGGRDLINICSSSTCCDHSKDLIEKQTWSLDGVHIWMIDRTAAKTVRSNELCVLGREESVRRGLWPNLVSLCAFGQ